VKAELDCLPCMLRRALQTARAAGADGSIQRQVVYSVAQILPELPLSSSPPELSQRVYRLVAQITGNHDPYLKEKQEANRIAMKLYPQIKRAVAEAQDPLLAACKFAIAGNILDLGSQSQYPHPETLLETALGLDLVINDYADFRTSAERAKLILYLADNAGEVVFDRVLIEQILQISEAEIYFMVREKPIINDATREDAQLVGLNKLAQIVTTGSDAPAFLPSECPPEVLKLYRSAELVISKGQGNFEALSEERKNIFFLLRAKCPVAARFLGVDIGAAILKKQE